MPLDRNRRRRQRSRQSLAAGALLTTLTAVGAIRSEAASPAEAQVTVDRRMDDSICKPAEALQAMFDDQLKRLDLGIDAFFATSDTCGRTADHQKRYRKKGEKGSTLKPKQDERNLWTYVFWSATDDSLQQLGKEFPELQAYLRRLEPLETYPRKHLKDPKESFVALYTDDAMAFLQLEDEERPVRILAKGKDLSRMEVDVKVAPPETDREVKNSGALAVGISLYNGKGECCRICLTLRPGEQEQDNTAGDLTRTCSAWKPSGQECGSCRQE